MTTLDLEETRAAWDAIAPGYDRYVTPTEAPLANEALALAGVGRGTSFLDVAAGCGGLSLPAARRGAQVLATDLSPAMIDLLERRAREEALAAVEARVMDAHALDLPDDAYDVTGSQFGVMLVPDQPRALREMVRVTKPGGRVLMVAYAAPTRLDFLAFFLGALQAVAPGSVSLPEDPPPLEFQAADPDVLRARMVDAGLHDVLVTPSAERLEVRSGDELWDWVLNGNPIAPMLVAGLSEVQRAEVRRALDATLRERAASSGAAVIENAVHIGIGTK